MAAKKSAKKKSPVVKTPVAKASTKPAGAKVNKSAFIRERADKKPAEIVAEAKKLGLGISLTFVYAIRGAAKKKALKTGVGAAPAATASSGQLASAEAQFRSLVIRVGTERATEILRRLMAE